MKDLENGRSTGTFIIVLLFITFYVVLLVLSVYFLILHY